MSPSSDPQASSNPQASSDPQASAPSFGDGHDAPAPQPASTDAFASDSVPSFEPPRATPPPAAPTLAPRLASAPLTAAPGPEARNIDKIRDILFGNQMVAYEARFAQLEERIAGEMDALRGELRRRFDTLETFVKDEVASLGRRLTEEHQARTEADGTLADALRQKNDALAKRVTDYRDAAAAAERALRQQLLQQATRAADDLREQTEQTQRTVQQHVADLGHRKTDRAALAALFSELAVRISGTEE
ncbi:MAG: hypothetical protein AAGG50_18595 [Bacteroidota bacterium]